MALSGRTILKVTSTVVCLLFLVFRNFQVEAKPKQEVELEDLINFKQSSAFDSGIHYNNDATLNPTLNDVDYFKNFYQNLDQNGPFFCGQLLGEHYMIGNYNFCGGLNVNDCSALCYTRNFTYFQCEGNICHCFS